MVNDSITILILSSVVHLLLILLLPCIYKTSSTVWSKKVSIAGCSQFKGVQDKSSKFVKLQPGEKKVLLFVPEKTEQVEADFNGKKSLRFRYTVIEEGSDNEKYFEVSKRSSEKIDALLLAGHIQLKISRFGLGVETIYDPVPV